MTDEAGKYQYKALSLNANNTVGWLKEVATVVNQIFRGKIQCTGQVTLTASATSTVVNNPNCSEYSVVHLSPLTANASSVYTSTYVSAYTDGQFTITHTSLGSADRTYRYTIFG
jgi:hypothetical protein